MITVTVYLTHASIVFDSLHPFVQQCIEDDSAEGHLGSQAFEELPWGPVHVFLVVGYQRDDQLLMGKVDVVAYSGRRDNDPFQ